MNQVDSDELEEKLSNHYKSNLTCLIKVLRHDIMTFFKHITYLSLHLWLVCPVVQHSMFLSQLLHNFCSHLDDVTCYTHLHFTSNGFRHTLSYIFNHLFFLIKLIKLHLNCFLKFFNLPLFYLIIVIWFF